MQAPRHPRPDYGIDAPGLVRAFFVVGLVAGAVSAGGLVFLGGSIWGLVAAGACGLVAVYGLGMGLFMLTWSRVVKVRRRERLLNLIEWKGDEAVLDVGCGRGLMLVGAARRVPGGGAVGVDVWSGTDQADNRPEATRENARREGVADRVSVETADARSLPCPDGSFDVVLSHWVVHNLKTADDRERAVGEMVRVLKPGGTLVLADIALHAEYAAQLARLGLEGVRHVGGGWLGWLSAVVSFGSFHPAAVTARKSAFPASARGTGGAAPSPPPGS